MICLYLKVSKNFMRHIFLDRHWFVHIPFVSRAKFSSLAQFPVDRLSYPVMPTLIFILYQLAAFAYNGINCFIILST